MYVFVYDWVVKNCLKSNHLELVVPSGLSYICFFENDASQLNFRVLRDSSICIEYMTPMRLLECKEVMSFVKVYRKQVTPYVVRQFRNECFQRCVQQSMYRMSFGFIGYNEKRRRWLSDLINHDKTWKLCLMKPATQEHRPNP